MPSGFSPLYNAVVLSLTEGSSAPMALRGDDLFFPGVVSSKQESSGRAVSRRGMLSVLFGSFSNISPNASCDCQTWKIATLLRGSWSAQTFAKGIVGRNYIEAMGFALDRIPLVHEAMRDPVALDGIHHHGPKADTGIVRVDESSPATIRVVESDDTGSLIEVLWSYSLQVDIRRPL